MCVVTQECLSEVFTPYHCESPSLGLGQEASEQRTVSQYNVPQVFSLLCVCFWTLSLQEWVGYLQIHPFTLVWDVSQTSPAGVLDIMRDLVHKFRMSGKVVGFSCACGGGSVI
ncbi:hypothetical protein BaRGS_00003815 [Batillaria attramentaria]|uniref:Uncharacterized protein n=1 Tax=Batillaria attramentaria TaxID=370345 RepID=A0ABD0LZH9_9CAEN